MDDSAEQGGPRMSAGMVVIGEALVDVVAGGGAHVGGSPLNVAVGLAQLGLPTRLHARVGADAYGELITAHLQRAGVVQAPGFVDGGRTSTAVASIDEEGRVSYEFDLEWAIEAPAVEGAALVHTGSIAAVREPGGSVTRSAVHRAGPGTLRSFDPNIRPDVMGDPAAVRRHVRELAAHCHVVKLSDEDALWLGEDTGEEPAEVLRSIAASGVRLAVMTRGPLGCIALVDGEAHELPARPVSVADTIGAGDAFMSGLLFGLVRDGGDRLLAEGAPLPGGLVRRVLSTALESAAVAVSRTGARPPGLAELEAALEAAAAEDGAEAPTRPSGAAVTAPQQR